MTSAALRLLNDFQRGFPLCPRPYRAIAERIGECERWVIDTLEGWRRDGVVSRVGAVFAPGAVGASTLAALAVPPERLDALAAVVNSYPQVNHNYAREHRFNLWFVVTAEDEDGLQRTLASIESQAAGAALIALPLLEEYRIDLGFDLAGGCTSQPPAPVRCSRARAPLDVSDRKLVAALEEGLPLTPRPFMALGAQAGMRESEAVQRLEAWLEQGVIRRFGVVVRHRELGYTANAMTVWDVPDDVVRAHGERLATQPGVTLCYRRRRALPHWPYNLFCMIHGRARDSVLQRIAQVSAAAGLEPFPRQVLFSRSRFKQQGARYCSEASRAPAAAASACSTDPR